MSQDATALWKSLLATALLGTGRGATPNATDWSRVRTKDGSLANALESVAGDDSETRLLHSAAVLSTYMLAGREPAHSDSETATKAADAEVLPLCPDRATAFLEELLGGRGNTSARQALFIEWLQTAAAHRVRVPFRQLPILLQIGLKAENAPILRSAIVPVVGRRGIWLAQQNPDWSWLLEGTQDLFALAEASETTFEWSTATTPERLAYLQRLRRTDPEAAIEQIAGTWDEERSETRSAMLRTLEINLRPEDEKLLELALDNRSREVRYIAAGLLARLPKSAFAGRMRARAIDAVVVKKPLIGGARVEVNPLETFDPTMERDGIVERPTGAFPNGVRAFWLQQIVASTPLLHWSEISALSPAEYIEAGLQNDWKIALLTGWTQAANREKNKDWLEALWLWHLNPRNPAPYHTHLSVDVLPIPVVFSLLEAAIDSSDFARASNLPVMLLQSLVARSVPPPESWQETVTTQLIQRVEKDYGLHDWRKAALPELGRLLGPNHCVTFLRFWNTLPYGLSSSPRLDGFSRFVTAITTRKRIHDAFIQGY